MTQSILDQLEIMKVKPQFRGSVILLHDGGGDRSATVAALPMLIDTLRATATPSCRSPRCWAKPPPKSCPS